MLVPHRQRLPSSAVFACSGVGFGFFSSSATVAITKPGVQKPHIKPSLSQNACCTGCSVLPCDESVNRPDVFALRLDREHRARVIGAAFDDHRARAAGAAIADALLAGDLEPRAHRIKQRHARFHLQLMPPAVDRQRDRHFARTNRRRALGLGILDAGDDGGGNRSDPDGLEEVAAGDVLLSSSCIWRRIRLFPVVISPVWLTTVPVTFFAHRVTAFAGEPCGFRPADSTTAAWPTSCLIRRCAASFCGAALKGVFEMRRAFPGHCRPLRSAGVFAGPGPDHHLHRRPARRQRSPGRRHRLGRHRHRVAGTWRPRP